MVMEAKPKLMLDGFDLLETQNAADELKWLVGRNYVSGWDYDDFTDTYDSLANVVDTIDIDGTAASYLTFDNWEGGRECTAPIFEYTPNLATDQNEQFIDGHVALVWDNGVADPEIWAVFRIGGVQNNGLHIYGTNYSVAEFYFRVGQPLIAQGWFKADYITDGISELIGVMDGTYTASVHLVTAWNPASTPNTFTSVQEVALSDKPTGDPYLDVVYAEGYSQVDITVPYINVAAPDQDVDISVTPIIGTILEITSGPNNGDVLLGTLDVSTNEDIDATTPLPLGIGGFATSLYLA